MRFRVAPRDVPMFQAAKRMGLDEAAFRAALPRLIDRGFPRPDPDTGMFDLNAIDRWCDARNPHLFGGQAQLGARDARQVAADRLERMRHVG